MKPEIRRFAGPYHFLSNFFRTPEPISYEGLDYPTSEHAFQAAKSLSKSARRGIRDAVTPGQAKKLGQCVKLRDDWMQIRVQVMQAILRVKFSQPELRKKLLATGDALLVEGNRHNDVFWGYVEGRGGANNLGKILMMIRSELRAASGP